GASNFLVHGMKVAHQLIAYRRPIGLQLAIKERLSCDYVAERGEAVFLTLRTPAASICHESHSRPLRGDVDEKWKPALEPQVHEAEKRMIAIEVKMEALATLQFELKHFGLSIAAHEISAAGLHTTKDRNQT